MPCGVHLCTRTPGPWELEMKSVAESVVRLLVTVTLSLDGVDGRFTNIFIKNFEWFLSNGLVTDL